VECLWYDGWIYDLLFAFLVICFCNMYSPMVVKGTNNMYKELEAKL